MKFISLHLTYFTSERTNELACETQSYSWEFSPLGHFCGLCPCHWSLSASWQLRFSDMSTSETEWLSWSGWAESENNSNGLWCVAVSVLLVASDSSSLVTLMALLVSIWLLPPMLPGVLLFFRDSPELRLHSINCFFHFVLQQLTSQVSESVTMMVTFVKRTSCSGTMFWFEPRTS